MTKVQLFSKELQDAAILFKVLGHPARLAILKYLAETKVCMTGDISDELPLSRTTVNQHLRKLKELNLISGEIDGAKVNYCLNPEIITKMITVINKYFEKIDCCLKEKCDC